MTVYAAGAINSYAGSQMLMELASLDKLESLNMVISGNPDSLPVMEGEGVFKKLKKLKKVEIDLDFFCKVRACFVVALAKNNPGLTVLRLMNYPTISDKTLDTLVNSCPGLEEFSYCCAFDWERATTFTDLTDLGIERMVDSAKYLKHLRLDTGRTPHVTMDLGTRLRLLYPDLHITLSRTMRI